VANVESAVAGKGRLMGRPCWGANHHGVGENVRPVARLAQYPYAFGNQSKGNTVGA